MGCNHPFKGFWTGGLTENGKKELVLFPSTSGDLLSVNHPKLKGVKIHYNAPLANLDGKAFLKDPVPVPCGHCSGCRLANAKQWKIRCVLEAQEWRYTYFVTLTYDDAHLPFQDGESVLNKPDLQRFWKRLRHLFDFKFFACGEYGERYARPHYHALIFTDHKLDLVAYGVNKFVSKEIEDTWKLGLVEVSYADAGCISYVVGYVEKKQVDPLWFDYTVKPFRIMSRRPGLGSRYILRNDVLETGKVYGDFGGSTFSSVPHYILSLVEKEKSIKAYKDLMEQNGKRFSDLTDSVFDSPDEDQKGFLMDDAINKMLENKRKEKL